MLNRAKGVFGEEFAEKYLIKNGYRILEKNWTWRRGELDIICMHKNVLVFVEVKYRSSISCGYPIEGITPKKMKHLTRSICAYLATHSFWGVDWRLDFICLLKQKGKIDIDHVINVDVV